jgi:hypothetical protein
MTVSFGQVIPVTGPNIGFVGTVSRFGDRVITARQFQPYTTTNNLNFGDPAILIQNSSGGYWTTVADAVANAASNITNVVNNWAGFGVREVQQMITYPVSQAPGVQQVGYYVSGQMAEVCERGNGTVLLSVSSSPVAGNQVYTRVVLNGAVAAGIIGDWETNPVSTDLFTQEATTQTQGSANITLGSGTNTQNNQVVSGVGIAVGTYVVSGGGTTSIVLSQVATQTSTANILTFSNLVALPRTVLRTGFVDANGIVEITIKERAAA